MNLIKVIKNPMGYYLALQSVVTNFFRANFHKGKNVHCEICNWKGTRFFSGKCPKCNSLTRTRLIPFSISFFNLFKDDIKLLHIAPNVNEYNFIKSIITKNSQYDRLNITKADHINLLQDLTNTTIESNTYDLAISWHVFEHIVEDVKAISEVYRILKPNGNFLLSVPIYPANNKVTYEDSNILYQDYKEIHGHEDHCRSCGLDYYKRFEAVGFTTKTLQIENLNAEQINTYGLSKNHVVWCFSK